MKRSEFNKQWKLNNELFNIDLTDFHPLYCSAYLNEYLVYCDRFALCNNFK